MERTENEHGWLTWTVGNVSVTSEGGPKNETARVVVVEGNLNVLSFEHNNPNGAAHTVAVLLSNASRQEVSS